MFVNGGAGTFERLGVELGAIDLGASLHSVSASFLSFSPILPQMLMGRVGRDGGMFVLVCR